MAYPVRLRQPAMTQAAPGAVFHSETEPCDFGERIRNKHAAGRKNAFSALTKPTWDQSAIHPLTLSGGECSIRWFLEPPGGERSQCLVTIGEFFWSSTGELFEPTIKLRKP